MSRQYFDDILTEPVNADFTTITATTETVLIPTAFTPINAVEPRAGKIYELIVGGTVTTVELSEYKIGLATANFARSGLAGQITLVHEDAGRVLQRSADGAFDLVFLDSERPEYPGWWPDLKRVLRPGGLLVVDNATSHQAEMAPFVALVAADPSFATSLVPVGNGEFLAVKAEKGWSDPT